jgi:4-pyridoxolactonase
MGTKVFLLDGGSLALDHSQLFWNREPGRICRFPVYSVLIEHAEGRFLFDSGFNKAVFDQLRPGNALQTPAQTIPGALDLIGLRPSDITHVLNSHYHVDHVGGNRFCSCATTICHKLELEAATNPEPFEAVGYCDMSFAPHLRPSSIDVGQADDLYTPRLESITGDQEIAKGVVLFETPGHTPGHYSLMVQLADRRPMIFTGDACYAQRSIDLNAIPGTHTDPRAAYRSMQRLQDFARDHDAELFFSHDAEAWPSYVKAPGYYS